ncbi:G patch domain-containing protein 1-like [Glandiceps talaboti]
MDDDSDEELAPYGTPLKPIEEDAPRKKPINIEDQTVHDKQGRRRFHGAFTGGFSAGYYNTAGSKEGWTPSTFVSSRQSRTGQSQQRPEEFMDDEDLGEFGIAPKKITTTDEFLASDNRQKRAAPSSGVIPGTDPLAELILPPRIPMGVRLLRKMGWKEGQGIGPRVKRKTTKGTKIYGCAARPVCEDNSSDDDVYAIGHYFAPKDVENFLFKPKDDVHGIGYQGIDPRTAILQGGRDEQPFTLFDPAGKTSRKGISGRAFGVGAFEDDDDDIYAQDNMSNYDIALGGKDPTKNFGWTAPKQKKGSGQDDTRYLGTVLEGFQLSDKPKPANKVFSAPPLPPNFKPFHNFDVTQQPPSQSTISTGRFSLSAAQRGSILGEAQLPGPSSVFDMMSKEDKEKMKTAQNRLTSSKFSDTPTSQPTATSTVTTTPASNTPLFSGSVGDFKPFAKDPAKQKRYEEYLERRKSGRKESDSIPSGSMTEWEREHEKEEFARAASLYKPLSSMIAARFTSAKYSDDTEMVTVPEQEGGDKNDQMKAAQMKMFGKLTRDVFDWHPDRLLCKRFNVPDPYPGSTIVGLPTVKKDKFSVFNFLSSGWEGASQAHTTPPSSSKEQLALPSSATSTSVNLFSHIPTQLPPPQQTASGVDKLPSFISSTATSQSEQRTSDESAKTTISDASVKTGQIAIKNDSDSEERPPMDLFKAIFDDTGSEASSSSDSSEDEKQNTDVAEDIESAREIVKDHTATVEKDSTESFLGNKNDLGEDKPAVSEQLSFIFGSEVLMSETKARTSENTTLIKSLQTSESLARDSVNDNIPKNEQSKMFGPALPPGMQGDARWRNDESSERTDKKTKRRNKDHQKDSLHRKHTHKLKDKKKHKHKKEKKKKSKKHRHKHKSKSKHRYEDSDDDDDADNSSIGSDSDDVDRIDNTQLLQRLKSLPSRTRPRAADFM